MVTTINERKEQTLAFVMSLPISWREYTAAKILANLHHLSHSLAAAHGRCNRRVASSWCNAWSRSLHGHHGGGDAYHHFAHRGLGIITESQAWTTAGIFCSSLGINVLGYVFAHLNGISMYMWGMSVHWSSTALIVLICELLTVPVLLGATFYIQSRKTDFL